MAAEKYAARFLTGRSQTVTMYLCTFLFVHMYNVTVHVVA